MAQDGPGARTKTFDIDRVMHRDDVVAVAETIVQHPRQTLEPPTAPISSAEVQSLLGDLRRSAPRLRYLERIGEGGMGEVHVAEQTSLRRDVAVKSLRPERREPDAIRKMLQEAWITGALDHPNVVPVHEILLDEDGMPRILLKRIEGVPWTELMRSPEVVAARFGARDLLEWNLHILEEVCQAAAYAHQRGILHRDLKPENVMIGEFGEVYVVDWGIAVSFATERPRHLPHVSGVREIAGTPGYMAPEMLDADGGSLGPHTDIYLLGAILFEILAGRPPHEGETLKEILHAILEGPPPLPAGTPGSLEAICRRAMRLEGSERFESAAALRLAIVDFIRHRGSQRLYDRAVEKERQFEARLADIPEAPGPTELRELFALFAEVRFGLGEALSAWPGNTEAAARLRALTARMIELQLTWGDPRTAASLLGGLDGLPEDLVERVEAAVDADDAHRRSLHQLEAEMDPDTGRRTRTFLALVLGAAWTVAPLVHDSEMSEMGAYGALVVVPLGFLFFGGLLSIWARQSMMKSAINRFIVTVVTITLGATSLLAAGGAVMEVPIEKAHALIFVLWATAAALTAAVADVRMLVTGLGYGVGFAVVVQRPDLRLQATAACNAFMTVVVVILWAPPEWLRVRFPRLLAPRRDIIEEMDGEAEP